MPLNDHEYVNFSQEHELNHHLRVVGKGQTIKNREVLKRMGTELKFILDEHFLTHKVFREYIKTQLSRLDAIS